MALKATIQSTADPVVTKVIQGQVSLSSGISGLNVNYNGLANGSVLNYQSSSNTFVASAIGNLDGGLYNNGTF